MHAGASITPIVPWRTIGKLAFDRCARGAPSKSYPGENADFELGSLRLQYRTRSTLPVAEGGSRRISDLQAPLTCHGEIVRGTAWIEMPLIKRISGKTFIIVCEAVRSDHRIVQPIEKVPQLRGRVAESIACAGCAFEHDGGPARRQNAGCAPQRTEFASFDVDLDDIDRMSLGSPSSVRRGTLILGTDCCRRRGVRGSCSLRVFLSPRSDLRGRTLAHCARDHFHFAEAPPQRFSLLGIASRHDLRGARSAHGVAMTARYCAPRPRSKPGRQMLATSAPPSDR